MKKILYILSLFALGICYSQEKQTSDCQLKVENKLWIAEFEKTDSKIERINLIKQKIQSDSIYSYSEPKIVTSHGPINYHVDRNGNDCGCKILFFMQFTKKDTVDLNLNSNPELSNIVKKLESENVLQIYYQFDKKGQGIKGKNGKCGVVKLRMNY